MSVIEQIYIDEKEDYLLDFISVGDKHIPEVSFVLIDTLGLTMAADAMRTGLPMLPQDGDYDNNGWYNFYALANAKGETEIRFTVESEYAEDDGREYKMPPALGLFDRLDKQCVDIYGKSLKQIFLEDEFEELI